MREVHTEHIFRAEDGKLYKREYLTRSNVLRDDKEVNTFGLIRLVAIVLIVACVFSLFLKSTYLLKIENISPLQDFLL